MAYPLNQSAQQTVASGLGTWSYTIQTSGPHSVSVFSNAPTPTGLIVTVNQNSSPVSPTPFQFQPTQSEVNLNLPLYCTAGDVIDIVFTSSLSPDPSIPFIKSIINLHRGG